VAFEASVDSAMAALAGQCDQFGVMLAFRSDLSSLAALDRAVRAARCPWFGIDLDPVALLQDRWSADEVFSRLGGLVRHVRGRDALGGQGQGAGGRTKPMPVGRGSTSWAQLLRDLDAAGYGGFITIDPLELTDRAAGASVALAHLRTLI
jgi:sugar phosphate isomerase/epimerase